MADHTQRLNLGGGPNPVRGWSNMDTCYPVRVDERYQGEALVCWDMADIPWPFTDHYFDGIVANHSLQCLTHDQILPCLHECRRVLKPGGVLRILVPDVLGAFHAYEGGEHHMGDPNWPGFAAIAEDWDLDTKFAHYLTWGGSNRSCFTEWSLAERLDAAGFEHAVRCYPLAAWKACPTNGPEWMTDLDSRLGESIVVEAW